MLGGLVDGSGTITRYNELSESWPPSSTHVLELFVVLHERLKVVTLELDKVDDALLA